MKTIRSWNDLAVYGIKPLTAEACGLMYRILFDVTEQGREIIEKCLDVKLELAEPWNRNAIGSIMLPHEMLVPLGIFALLESGCTEVWSNNGMLLGVEPDDPEKGVELAVADAMRRFAYDGTAGSRNIHQMTKRVK